MLDETGSTLASPPRQAHPKSNRTTKSNSIPQSRFLSLIAVVVISLSFVTQVGPYFSTFSAKYYGTQLIARNSDGSLLGLDGDLGNKFDAIIFDAGSTGTRIHIFTFLQTKASRRVQLLSEVFHTVKPGLSAFAENASAAIDTLRPLLAKAEAAVAPERRSVTPLMLRATAGLRLLPSTQAAALMSTVEDFLRQSPFKLSEDAVSIMDGTDEGIYSWYTLNFLDGKLHRPGHSDLALDLGGGSVQITFSTDDTETLVTSPPSHIVSREIEGEREYLYSKSYLGFGLMSARKQILLSKANESLGLAEGELFTNLEMKSKPQNSSLSRDHVRLVHPCFRHRNKSERWDFENVTFEVDGAVDHFGTNFDLCYEMARVMVATSIHKPPAARHHAIFAMSYFFDRLADVKGVAKKRGVGVVRVKDYQLTAHNICTGAIRMKNQSPFLCLDLCYISAFLRDGLGLGWNQKITVIKKLDGYETSWSLGAALNLLNLSRQVSADGEL